MHVHCHIVLDIKCSNNLGPLNTRHLPSKWSYSQSDIDKQSLESDQQPTGYNAQHH